MNWLVYILVAAAGALNAVQAGSNARLAKGLDQPLIAAIIVYLVGISALLVSLPFFGVRLPSLAQVGELPWWAWVGGLLGGTYVLATLFFAEKLGSGVFTGLTVTAAIVASVLLDHFSWVGFAQHSVNLWRGLGCLLMISGLLLIAIF